MSKQAMEMALESACALGVIGNGYCFCSHDRDPERAFHEPECQEMRTSIAKLKEAIKQQGEPFGYARFIADEVGDWHFHSFAKTTNGWNDDFCRPLYTSAPSIQKDAERYQWLQDRIVAIKETNIASAAPEYKGEQP